MPCWHNCIVVDCTAVLAVLTTANRKKSLTRDKAVITCTILAVLPYSRYQTSVNSWNKSNWFGFDLYVLSLCVDRYVRFEGVWGAGEQKPEMFHHVGMVRVANKHVCNGSSGLAMIFRKNFSWSKVSWLCGQDTHLSDLTLVTWWI